MIVFVNNFIQDVHLLKSEAINILICSGFGLLFQIFVNGFIFYYSFYNNELDFIQCLILGLLVGTPGIG